VRDTTCATQCADPLPAAWWSRGWELLQMPAVCYELAAHDAARRGAPSHLAQLVGGLLAGDAVHHKAALGVVHLVGSGTGGRVRGG